jgi:O-glycosyl hydrolase
MAQTEHLPIYKASYDLCLYLEQVVAKFARTHIGSRPSALTESIAISATRHWFPERASVLTA